jgi:hypothetical protein
VPQEYGTQALQRIRTTREGTIERDLDRVQHQHRRKVSYDLRTVRGLLKISVKVNNQDNAILHEDSHMLLRFASRRPMVLTVSIRENLLYIWKMGKVTILKCSRLP